MAVRQMARLARFKPVHNDPADAVGLKPGHPALHEGRTIFPKSVIAAAESPRLLVSGKNNPKMGEVIVKGSRAGWPIYHLTLEERATCPRTCAQWADCFVPGTKVLTADFRWVQIEALAVGQEIPAFDEYADGRQHRMTKMATVEAVGRTVQPCFRVMTDKGDVTVSAGHLWLRRRSRTAYQWDQTTVLKPGDKLQFFAEPWETDTSYDAGRLRAGSWRVRGTAASAVAMGTRTTGPAGLSGRRNCATRSSMWLTASVFRPPATSGSLASPRPQSRTSTSSAAGARSRDSSVASGPPG